MTNEPETTSEIGAAATATKAERPQYRLWLVQDRSDRDEPDWTELSGLWPRRSGEGFSGHVDRPVALRDGKIVGRLVVLPARFRPGSDSQPA